MIAVPLRDQTAQTVAEALIYRVIYLLDHQDKLFVMKLQNFISYYTSYTLYA